ncbi:hypothetical protein P6U18_05865, partial [Pseudomonas sp. L01]|nr:hypothetical protein [Pseudomonas sp. L01]
TGSANAIAAARATPCPPEGSDVLRRCTRPPPRRITARGYSPYAPVVPAPVGRMTPTALSTDTAISATAV